MTIDASTTPGLRDPSLQRGDTVEIHRGESVQCGRLVHTLSGPDWWIVEMSDGSLQARMERLMTKITADVTP